MAYTTEGRWVVTVDRYPILSDFQTTRGQGSPLVIDRTSGIGYYLAAGDVITAMGADAVPGPLNVLSFGATGDGVTDDRAAIQDALDFANSIGGAEIWFPVVPPQVTTTYKISGYLSIYPKTRIKGLGRSCVKISTTAAGGGGANAGEDLQNGSVFTSIQPINSSTRVDIFIEDIGLETTAGGASLGAGFYDRCGTFIQLERVRIDGFKYGAVFDQSELVDIDICDFEGQITGGIWLVNGADLTPGALASFTNRISVNKCQFNQAPTAYCVIDDGGYVHAYTDNNYNGGLQHLRLAGVGGLQVRGGEFESAAEHSIVLDASSLAGNAVGSSVGAIYGAAIAATTGYACINILSVGTLEIAGGCAFATPTGDSVRGCVNAFKIIPGAILASFAADKIFDNYATVHGAPSTLQAAVPASGYHRAGEIVFTQAPSSGVLLWRCVTSGTPGTWETIAPPGAIPVGGSLVFDDVSGVGWQGFVERTSSAPYRIQYYISEAASGTWQSSHRFQVQYNGNALFDALTINANTDGTTAACAIAGTLTVADNAFSTGWNGSFKVPTENAVYDKITTGLTAAELAANSGGGTTNFLRADGSWSTPAGSDFVLADTILEVENANTSKATFLQQEGRAGWFIFDPSDLSAFVTIDTEQGVFIAPTSDPTGASGAWVRSYSGAIKADWFGLAADGTTDDGPVVAAAIALANALAGSNLTGYGTAVPTVELPFTPAGINMGSTTISLTHATVLRGQGGGAYGGAATHLHWSAGVNGIEVRAANCILEKLALKGGFVMNVTAEGEYHAIKSYFRFTYRDLFITLWQGDGIFVDISAGSGGDTEGNANCVWGERLVIDSTRNGLSLEGSDANAGNFLGVDVNYARQWGIRDDSFLGNTYIGPHVAGCGIVIPTAGPFAAAYYSGRFYYVVAGQEAGASTNAPSGTTADNTYWRYWKDAAGATAYAPLWSSGISVRSGGPYYSGNSHCTFINPYEEGGQPPSQHGNATLVINGVVGDRRDPEVNYIIADSADGAVKVGKKFYVKGDFIQEVKVGGEFRIDGSVNGATVDPDLTLKTGNLSSGIVWQKPDGSPYAKVFSLHNWGAIYYDAYSGSGAHNFQIAHVQVASVDANGYNLEAGKVLKVAGNQVVGARGAAIANATDAASAITQLNLLLAAARTHGLIAT